MVWRKRAVDTAAIEGQERAERGETTDDDERAVMSETTVSRERPTPSISTSHP